MKQPTNWLDWREAASSLQAVSSLRLVVICVLALVLWCSPVRVGSAWAQLSHPYLAQAAEQLELHGKQLADERDFEAAANQFEQAAASYRGQGDEIGEAIALSNLASVQGQMGLWDAADLALDRSLELLNWSDSNSVESNPSDSNQLESLPSEHKQLVAQVLDVRGRLLFDRDRLEDAYDAWQTSQALFAAAGDLAGSTRIQIEQARVLQALGFYGRASDRLQVAVADLDSTSDRHLQSSGFRQLGNALLLAGDVTRAEQNLLRSLEIARQTEDSEAIAASQLSLGNVARWVGDEELALDYYAQAAARRHNSDVQLRADLNQLDVLLTAERWSQLQQQFSPLKSRIAALPPSRNALLARVKLLAFIADLRLQQPDLAPATEDMVEWAATTRQQARLLGDRRAEAQILGLLGHLYEQSQQFDDATPLTVEAIALAQAERNFDVAYRWQWQLGRILVAQRDRPAAISAYQSALATLDILRGDLAAVNPDAQFAFQDSIEPVHRQLVELLLEEEQEIDARSKSNETIERLDVARQTLERLQLAELDNFFRAACIDSVPVAIEDVDADAVVIYPIVLPDRLELLVHLPGQPLRQVTVEVSSDELARTVARARLAFGQRTSTRYLPLAQQLYDWIVRPVAADLVESGADTLVFVPDGILRNVPMGALHDGEQYLLERYAIAVSPGLELLPPAQIDIPDARILTAGLSQPRQGFTGLAHVIAELDKIDANLAGRSLRDREFTQQSLQKAMGDDDFSFVHIATHGQFSSQLDRTFLLAWDDTIDINQLRSFIVASDFSRERPLDLLVLSACETAAGDRRAALGLAGIATRSGARSTVATLWKVSDEMTANIVDRFYQNLVVDGMTKAKALQQAQLALYTEADTERQHPFYWGAFVLVGNWQ
ncbi:MAG: CHAT domain-containing protein [Cyanobacteria bacterium J06642_12]